VSTRYFNFGNNTLYNLKETWTIAVWFKTDDTVRDNLLSKMTASNEGEWELFFAPSSEPIANALLWRGWYDGGSGSEYCEVANTSVAYIDNSWHRVVVTRDSSGLNMYVNNVLIATAPCSAAYTFTSIANMHSGGYDGNYYKGLIDDVQLWNLTWSADDVNTDWNNGIGREADETSGGYAWRSIGNHSETSVLNWDIKNIQPQSGVDLKCKAIDLSGSNTYSDYYSPIINLTITFPDTSKFFIKNDSNDTIAWLGNFGNIALKGKCNVLSNCVASSENLFVITNSSAPDEPVAYINSSGDLCAEKGNCSSSASCNEKNAFKIRNSTQELVSYIDFNGELCFTGGLYENADL